MQLGLERGSAGQSLNQYAGIAGCISSNRPDIHRTIPRFTEQLSQVLLTLMAPPPEVLFQLVAIESGQRVIQTRLHDGPADQAFAALNSH